jgi:hypothetical protein
VGEHRTFRITKPKRFVVLVLLGLLVAGIGVHVYFRFHLDGVYDDLQMACDCNWVFKDGQIYEVTEKGRTLLGTYRRDGFRWVCRPLKGLGGEIYMQSSLLGLWWSDPLLQRGGRFLPRRCFSPFAASLYDWYIRI